MRKIATDLSTVTTVGLDIAKYVFQVHAIDASGRVLVGITGITGTCITHYGDMIRIVEIHHCTVS